MESSRVSGGLLLRVSGHRERESSAKKKESMRFEPLFPSLRMCEKMSGMDIPTYHGVTYCWKGVWGRIFPSIFQVAAMAFPAAPSI